MSLAITKTNLKKQFASREFLLFLIVGAINTGDCSLFATILMKIGIRDGNVAFNIGYLISNLLAYYLNCRFIFYSKIMVLQYLRFAISYIPNAMIENIVVIIFFNLGQLPPLVSFLLAAVLGMPITFLLVKLFAFRCH